VQVYQTNLDLFYSSKLALVGTLAFSLSSQQLFIRVNDGWRVVKLEGFHPALESHANVPSKLTNALSEHNLPFWLSDDTANFQIPSFESPAVSSVVLGLVESPLPAFARNSLRSLALKEQPTSASQLSPRTTDKDHVLHLIALNTPFSGDMRGVRGADFACYQQARTAGFTTTFRALLSSQVQDLNKIVHYSDRETPVVNLRGDRLYDSWTQLLHDSTFNSRATIFSFDRRDVLSDNTWPEKLVWHGSDGSGVRSEGRYCEAWRSANSGAVGVASPLEGRQVLGVQQVDCSRKLIVLCIENMSKHNVDKRLGKKRIPRGEDDV
uniref:Collagenase NC10/endostatin domain-containing protein n=1 Tax=Plectus sambesii TaxID=2011161 RepID=A0A914XIA2_9BILA